MTQTTVKTEAKWKQQYQLMFSTTSKKNRATKDQINHIKSQAKLLVAIWG